VSSESLITPSADRARKVDAAIRHGLASSLEYLGTLPSVGGFGGRQAPLFARLAAGPVSPWVFALYSRLVFELSRGDERAAATASDLADVALAPTPGDRVIPFLADGAPAGGWEQFRILFDSDPTRIFNLRAPDGPTLERCRAGYDAAMDLLARAAPEVRDEVASLLRLVVFASPADSDSGFNGASTFFMWGASVLNAEPRREPAAFCDLLIHEASHLLLFGKSAEAPLTDSRGDEELASPFRSDKRPADGIFHACFVAARVHCAMRAMLAGGSLRGDEVPAVEARARHNGEAARKGLDTLAANAKLTPLGREIFDQMRAYWAEASLGEAL
jgi:HEXXH motif-containing protein